MQASGDETKSAEQKLQEAISYKDKGNDLVKEKKLAEALVAYTAAIDLVPTNELFWSNRSMVYYQLGDGQNALADAEKCIEINRNWGRGYSRKVNALQLLRRNEDIIDTCRKGLAIEKSDALVKNLNIACLELLEGKFWGTTSEVQGAYEQELEFFKEKCILKVRFFGQEIVCSYRIDPTQSPMTMVIGMPQQPPILHIFRFTEQGMDLCSPALPSGANPTSFEGDGFIALKRGPQPEEPEDPALAKLTLLEKLAIYVEEAINVVPDKIEDNQPDAFLKIIHFQKNFYRLRARYGPDVAEYMTRLLQGDISPEVPEALVRRIYVLREKMREAHLFEDPNQEGGEEQEDLSGSTGNVAGDTTSTPPPAAAAAAAATAAASVKPSESKQQAGGGAAAAVPPQRHANNNNNAAAVASGSSAGEGKRGPSFAVKAVGFAIVAGAVVAGVYWLWKRTEKFQDLQHHDNNNNQVHLNNMKPVSRR